MRPFVYVRYVVVCMWLLFRWNRRYVQSVIPLLALLGCDTTGCNFVSCAAGGFGVSCSSSSVPPLAEHHLYLRLLNTACLVNAYEFSPVRIDQQAANSSRSKTIDEHVYQGNLEGISQCKLIQYKSSGRRCQDRS